MAPESDWDLVHALASRVIAHGEALELSGETCALLRSAAQDVAIPSEEAERALRGVVTATDLLREVERRIQEGSERLMDARLQADRLRDTGDLRGAIVLLEGVLAVEVVPLYRKQAEATLKRLTRLEAVATSGHVDAELRPWEQLPLLAHRIQQGKALELRDDLRDFLRRTAPSVAISDAEAAAALQSAEGAEALVGKMVGRIREGRQRITQALFRMTRLRDAGDLEGARQQMREVLAVEVVPLYREMAEENLAGLDEPPPVP